MSRLTPSDLQTLAAIPIRTVVDFRARSEIAASPDKTPHTVLEPIQASVVPGNVSGAGRLNLRTPEDSMRWMLGIYRQLAKQADAIHAMRTVFALLAEPANTPLLYHCTAGKDRTGAMTALILAALGVDWNDILRDYLESNACLKRKYGDDMARRPHLVPLYTVKREYLDTFFEEIRDVYGNVETFLTDALAVDIDKMRRLYLEQ